MTKPLERFETFDTEPYLKSLSNEDKAQIDAMTYKELLQLWETAPIGHPLLQGLCGRYFRSAMETR